MTRTHSTTYDKGFFISGFVLPMSWAGQQTEGELHVCAAVCTYIAHPAQRPLAISALRVRDDESSAAPTPVIPRCDTRRQPFQQASLRTGACTHT